VGAYIDRRDDPVRVELDTRHGRLGGWLEGWISTPSGWDGYVHCSTEPGSTYLGRLSAKAIRPLYREGGGSGPIRSTKMGCTCR
jgi:hypothetical protein